MVTRTLYLFVGNTVRQAGAFLLLLALLTVAPLSAKAQGPSDGRQKWALLVGVAANINPANILLGPRNDIPAMEQLLREKYGFPARNIRSLLDTQATKASILEGWEWLIKNAGRDDQVVFYFSGHGIDVADPTKPNGRGSALCPYDARNKAGLLLGREVGALVDRLKTPHVTVIVDACNSGYGSRDLRGKTRAASVRDFADMDPLPARSSTSTGNATPFVDSATGGRSQKERYLGAARVDQSARDWPLLPGDGGSGANLNMGAMTYYLLQELRADTTNALTYAELLKRVRVSLREKFGPEAQEPQASGPALEAPFLALAGEPQPPRILPGIVAEVVSVKGTEVTVRAAGGATLTPGSVLEATGSKRWVEDIIARGEGRGLIRLGNVNGTTAAGTLLSGNPAPGEVLTEAMRGIGDSQLRVAVQGKESSALRDSLSGSSLFRGKKAALVGIKDSNDVVLYADDRDAVQPYRGGLPLPPVPADKVEALLRALHAGKQLLDLSNPKPALRVTVRLTTGEEGYAEARIGNCIKYVIECDKDAQLTLLGLSADGIITGTRESITVKAGVRLEVPVGVEGPVGLDVLKVIATLTPLSLQIPVSPKEAKAVGAPEPAEVAQSILTALRRDVNQNSLAARSRGQNFARVADGGGAIVTDGWATAEFLLRINP